MIINFDLSIIKYIHSNNLYDDEDIIDSLNTLLKISHQKQHLVVSDVRVSDFLYERFFDKLDNSCLQQLKEISGNASLASKTFLNRFPSRIQVVGDDSIELNHTKVEGHPIFEEGRIFHVNIRSAKNYNFLGDRIVLLSEHLHDVEVYSRIGVKYLKKHYSRFVVNDFKAVSGIGGNINEKIKELIDNKEKTLILCDTDKKTRDGSYDVNSTYTKAFHAYSRFMNNHFISLVSVDVQELENLIPASWINEYSRRPHVCSNVLSLEASSFKDRLLFLDFKQGLTKKEYLSNPEIYDFYKPAVEELGIDIDSLQDGDFLFEKVANRDWIKVVRQILTDKNLEDFPDYLEGHIETIGLNISSWIIGGDTERVGSKVYLGA